MYEHEEECLARFDNYIAFKLRPYAQDYEIKVLTKEELKEKINALQQ